VDKLLVEIHAMVHREALPRSVLKLITLWMHNWFTLWMHNWFTS
jgi:hypothetical protein